MNKKEKEDLTCKIVKQSTQVKLVEVKKGLLNSVKICFDKKPPRYEQERIKKCLRENKIKHIMGDKCIVIR